MRKTHFSTIILALVQNSLAHNVIELHGSGTTNPSKCLWSIMERFEEKAKEPLHMTYRAIGEFYIDIVRVNIQFIVFLYYLCEFLIALFRIRSRSD